jgi:hypothetical protein
MKNETQNTITFKGENYPIKTIEVRDKVFGKRLIKVATESLNRVLDGSNVSKRIDTIIEHFVDEETFETLPSVISELDVKELFYAEV